MTRIKCVEDYNRLQLLKVSFLDVPYIFFFPLSQHIAITSSGQLAKPINIAVKKFMAQINFPVTFVALYECLRLIRANLKKESGMIY